MKQEANFIHNFPRISKSKVSVLSGLHSKKMRLKHGLFIVEGLKSIREIALSDKFSENIVSLISIEDKIKEIADIAFKISENGSVSPEVLLATPEEMKKISSLTTAPDSIAVCKLPDRNSQKEILSEPLPQGLYLLLDDIQDPGNLGTIIRTAHWFGIKKIFASTSTVDLYNPKTIQSSMGSLASVDLEYMDLCSLIDSNLHVKAVGLLLNGQDIFTASLPSSAFIIMGNEGNGISPTLLERIDIPLTIPPYNHDDHSESLNVAIATAITLAQFRGR